MMKLWQNVYNLCKVYKNCGNSTVACNYLAKIANATEMMMIERAKTSKNKNFLLTQHFPSVGGKLLHEFKQNRINMNISEMETIWMAYGHDHEQECDGYVDNDRNGTCELIRTGGGGGCCNEGTLRGFYVIGFDDNKNMIQPLKITDPLLTCEYPCHNLYGTKGDDSIEHAFEICCHTIDSDMDCSLFDLARC